MASNYNRYQYETSPRKIRPEYEPYVSMPKPKKSSTGKKVKSNSKSKKKIKQKNKKKFRKQSKNYYIYYSGIWNIIFNYI